jgi:MFS family permease
VIDPVNPYQAPEAAIVGSPEALGRPPVYTAISIFSWIAGVAGILLSAGFLPILGLMTAQQGWRRVFLTGIGLRVVLILALIILAAMAFIAAGRLLWDGRGRQGLIFCSTAIGITYVAAWIYTSS